MTTGPLAGTKVIELAGIGPGPFCGMMLADMGAEVVRIEPVRARAPLPHYNDPLLRGRRSIKVDLKKPEGVELVLRLVERADVLFEGFRPGVVERVGLSPETCLARNPRLVFGRVTGWGQDGPLATCAGHDINFISVAGALHPIGVAGGKPVPPLNLVGDFGGGGMLLAFGIVCALLETSRSGRGQVVDAAMLDGAAALMAMFVGFESIGLQRDEPGRGFLAGAAHFYDTYETRDGKYVAVGAIEPEFYAAFVEAAGLDEKRFAARGFNEGAAPDAGETWAELKREISDVFKTKSRDEWCRIFEGKDACVTPVLTLAEAMEHPHVRARGTYADNAGEMQNSPAPRFSRSTTPMPPPAVKPGSDTDAVLSEFGFTGKEIADLHEKRIVGRV